MSADPSASADDLAARLLPLSGGVNFRDMGGYRTVDGRRVKWGQLYRSGSMTRLTDEDRAHLNTLGIRAVIDFRTLDEQESEPNDWGLSLGDRYWRRQHSETFGNWSGLDPARIKSAADVEKIMEAGFRKLPQQQADAYAEMFRRLAAGHVPAVIHCTAGKDRTGGGAALILSVLGVPRETILADFEMTERAVDLGSALRHRKPNKRYDTFKQIDPQAVKAFSSARPVFIAAFLDALDEQHGSTENYLYDLGITGADLDTIRAALLE